MIRNPNNFTYLRKLALLGWLLLVLAGFSSCVDINDARVQVQPPGETDPYARNVLDKCPPHTNPHRLVVAQTVSNSVLATMGSQMANSQQEFDKYWNYLSALEPGSNVITSSLSQEPVVNWSEETVYFLVVAIDNSCQKTKLFGDEMTTDCYSTTIPLYRYMEGNNCQQPSSYQVFVFIYPKTTMPVEIKWIYPTPIPTATPTVTPTATPRPTGLRKPTPTPESDDD